MSLAPGKQGTWSKDYQGEKTVTQLTEESRNEKSSTDSVSACGHSPTDAVG